MELPITFLEAKGNFFPRKLPNLVLWLRSDLGITLNGSNVSAWADQSGNGNNVSQGTAAQQPVFNSTDSSIRNKPSLTFDGSNDVLIGTPAAALTSNKNWSFFVVHKPNSFATVKIIASIGNGSTGYAFSLNGNSTNKREMQIKLQRFVEDGAAASGSYEYWTGQCNNSAVLSMRVNGASQSLDFPNTTPSTPSADVEIGAANSGGTGSFNGRIAEVILYNRLLSSIEVAKVEKYIKKRYGL